MSKNWGMNFEGHVPTFGQRLPEGDYLMEIVEADATEKEQGGKGDYVTFKYKVVDGGGQEGSIASDRLYILNDRFSGSDGHAAATKDNWYFLLSATKMPLSNHGDMREVAKAMVGRRLAATVVHTKSRNSLGEERTYANFNNLRPAESWGDSVANSAPADDLPAEPSDNDVAEATEVDLSAIE